MASYLVNSGSNKPPLASKKATYKIVSSKPKNVLSLFSNSLCKLLVPHINLTEAIPKPSSTTEFEAAFLI